MSRIQVVMAVGLLTVGLFGSGAYAQDIEGVTVQGSRVVKETIGKSMTGTPINAISLAYNVSYKDLDLSTTAGSSALEKRVQDAADAACKEIGRLYPQATPSNVECAKAAVEEAMVKVHDLVAAASKTK